MEESYVRFSQKDPELCRHYASFASGLQRTQFDIIYWLLFAFNLLILFTAAKVYIKLVLSPSCPLYCVSPLTPFV